MRTIWNLANLILCAGVVLAQTTTPSTSFEVASVKPSTVRTGSVVRGGPGTPEPGRISCSGCTLATLVNEAYNLTNSWQLVGPPTMSQGTYDVVASVPAGAKREDVRVMLQNLLKERFGLVVQREKRDLPLYNLTLAKGGQKLRTPEKGTDPPPPPKSWVKDADGFRVVPSGTSGVFLDTDHSFTRRRVSFRAQSMDNLAERLQLLLHRPVVDQTELPGVYDFDLTFAADPVSPAVREYSEARAATGAKTASGAAAASPQTPSVETAPLNEASDPIPDVRKAVEVQLGLKLVEAKGAVEVLVVEKFNPVPIPD